MTKSYILCLETSGPSCSVSLSLNGRSISNIESEGEWKHSQYLTTKIQECLAEAGLTLDKVQAIGISRGPGSYTGLRVGSSTAKGICYALEIPLIAIDTLKVIAYPELHHLDKDNLKYIIPLIDARRDEVYCNVYNDQFIPEIDTQPLILNEDSFSKYLELGAVVCGDGAAKASELLKFSQNTIFATNYPKAINMAALAYERYVREDFEDTAYFNPFYLKPPNITVSKKSIL